MHVAKRRGVRPIKDPRKMSGLQRSLFNVHASRDVGAKKNMALGCEACDLNGIHSKIRKVTNLKNVLGRRAMAWAQSPGGRENAKGLNLVGDSGRFLWSVLKEVDLGRADFDLQNVVRCWPVDVDELGEIVVRNTPTKDEVRQCSVFNGQALERNQGKAVVHLVLGDVAARSLLGRRYRKDNPIFWHDLWEAYVVTTFHPAYLLRIGGKGAGQKYKEFKARVQSTKTILEHPGRFGYIFSRPYKPIAESQLSALLEKLGELEERGWRVGADIEASGERILTLALSWGRHDKGRWRGRAVYIPIEHEESTIPKAVAIDWLKEFCQHSCPKTFHYGASDEAMLRKRLRVRVRGFDRDSNYIAYFAYPDLKKYGLNSLAMNFFPEYADYKSVPSVYGKSSEDGGLDYGTVPLDKLGPYNCADAELSARIDDLYYTPRTKGLNVVYIRAARTLAKMELSSGFQLDYKACKRLEESLHERLGRLKSRLQVLSNNPELNPGSPPQVAKVIYGKAGSAGKEVFQGMINDGHPKSEFMEGVLRYRRLSKELGTYVKNYRKSADMNGGELRTIWNLTGAGTGRISGGGGGHKRPGKVNFQNLHGDPELEDLLMSDKDWELVWEAFEAGTLDSAWNRFLDAQVLLSADYSQIEVRILAHASQDPLLIEQFNTGRDIHSQVGHALTGWPEERIARDRETRRSIKELHFGIIYGLKNLYKHLHSKGINITESRANRMHHKYFTTYKGVRGWIEKQRKAAEKDWFVENLFGFRRPISMLESATGAYWANQAINTPIQGAAHQLLMIALGLLNVHPKRFDLLQCPVADVHDALVFYTTVRNLPKACQQLVMLMEHAVPEAVHKTFGWELSVPLVTEAKAGFKYGSQIDYYVAADELYGLSAREFLAQWCEKYKAIKAKFKT